jgi:uroporphyrinogen-III decarboxylase
MSNESLYQERLALIRRAIRLEPVDSIPVIYMGTAFSPRYMGMTMAEFCEDREGSLNVTLAAMDRLGGLDGINIAVAGKLHVFISAMWLSKIAIPGRDLPPDSLWQVHEQEVMTQADYDVIIEKGWQAFLMEYLPRVLDPVEFQEEVIWHATNAKRIQQAYQEHGYVVVTDAPFFLNIPFECLCGGRSMQKFFFDLYRMPDKVQAAMDVIFEDTMARIRLAPKPTGIGGAWLGGWRSASSLLAPKLWNRFTWPYLLKFANELVDNGFTPVLHWDQDWTRDLVRLQELPAKKCILNPDGMTDIRKFKELVGDRMAVMGDVPSSLFVAGTPDDIYSYVKELVRDVGPTGLLLCPGCDAPLDAKPENMEAFVAAAREFGAISAQR